MVRAIRLDDEVDRHELWRWALAALIMLAAHLGIVATYMLLHRPDAGPQGTPVVLIELAPAPVAPQQQEQVDLQPEPEMKEEQPEPERKVETPPEVLPLPPLPTPEVVTAVLPPPPEQPPEKKVEDKPPPKPVEAKKKAAPKTTPKRSAPAPADAPAASRLGIAAEANAAMADWRAMVSAHLMRYKRYPAGPQSRGEGGTAMLSFTVERSGRVTVSHLTRGSGVAELDAEVLSMIQRAQPLPAFPPAMTQARQSLSVPVRFTPR